MNLLITGEDKNGYLCCQPQCQRLQRLENPNSVLVVGEGELEAIQNFLNAEELKITEWQTQELPVLQKYLLVKIKGNSFQIVCRFRVFKWEKYGSGPFCSLIINYFTDPGLTAAIDCSELIGLYWRYNYQLKSRFRGSICYQYRYSISSLTKV